MHLKCILASRIIIYLNAFEMHFNVNVFEMHLKCLSKCCSQRFLKCVWNVSQILEQSQKEKAEANKHLKRDSKNTENINQRTDIFQYHHTLTVSLQYYPLQLYIHRHSPVSELWQCLFHIWLPRQSISLIQILSLYYSKLEVILK